MMIDEHRLLYLCERCGGECNKPCEAFKKLDELLTSTENRKTAIEEAITKFKYDPYFLIESMTRLEGRKQSYDNLLKILLEIE